MEAKNTFFEKYLTPIAVVLGALIIALALAYGRGDVPQPAEQGTGAVDIKEVATENAPFVGERNAPVTIAVWSDYQCPFCKRFELDTLKQVYDEYVTKGQVKIVFKDFQFLGPDSQNAALVGRAVWDAYPDQYYAWHTAVMNAQGAVEGSGFGGVEGLLEITGSVEGIDASRVQTLLDANKARYEEAIAADRAEGSKFGINGTPGTIIGTTLIAGARSFADIKPLIDAELGN